MGTHNPADIIPDVAKDFRRFLAPNNKEQAMGAHSTLNVTRDTALKLYMRSKHPEITDKVLESFLDEALDGALYNAVIVDSDAEDIDDSTAEYHIEQWLKKRANSGIKISVTARQIMDAGFWDDYCAISGTNVWAINEGLMDSDDQVTLELADARRYGFF